VAADTLKKPEIVDIGKLIHFTLSHAIVGKLEVQPHAMKLYTSFTTYNISYQYQLSWELRRTMAGENLQFDGKSIATLPPHSSFRQNLPTELLEVHVPFEKGEN
jgi:hypothetical protein